MLEVVLCFGLLTLFFGYLYSQSPDSNTASGLVYRLLFLFAALYCGYLLVWTTIYGADSTRISESFNYQNVTLYDIAHTCSEKNESWNESALDPSELTGGECIGTISETITMHQVDRLVNSSRVETSIPSEEVKSGLLAFFDAYTWIIYVIIGFVVVFLLYDLLIWALKRREKNRNGIDF